MSSVHCRGNIPREMRRVVICAIEYPDEEMERKALRSVVLQKEFTDDPELAMQKPEQMIAQGVHFQVHVNNGELGPCMLTPVVCYWNDVHLLLLCALQQCCIAGTSDVFLFYKGTAVFFHPQLRQHQQVPSLTELRGWLLMANEIMHLTVDPHHHTIQGGGVIDCIRNLLRSAGVHNLLCSEEKSYYM
jgi:hypothetical protein